jgi:hypothetical protein
MDEPGHGGDDDVNIGIMPLRLPNSRRHGKAALTQVAVLLPNGLPRRGVSSRHLMCWCAAWEQCTCIHLLLLLLWDWCRCLRHPLRLWHHWMWSTAANIAQVKRKW